MPTSTPAITVDDTSWQLITSVASTLQVRDGTCAIWFGTPPSDEVSASHDGKRISADRSIESENIISFDTDSDCYARATVKSKTARISITNHV